MAKTSRQVSQYDKILQENIEAALPGLIKTVLNIHAAISEELPDSLQHTKERRPDVLKKVTDDKGETFVLHIEFQLKDDPDMAYRMAEYLVMLLRLYRLPVRQYVIYIGEGISTMPCSLISGRSIFHYNLIAISSIDYRIFLRSEKPEEKMFAILASFGDDDPATVVNKIAASVVEGAKGQLEKEQRKNQLRILAKLRTLVSENIALMDSIASIFKDEKKILRRMYERIGAEENSRKVVKNLLLAKRFTIAEIANFAGVTGDFVREVKKTLKTSSI